MPKLLPRPQATPKYISPGEAARQLSVHVGTIYDFIKAGKIPGVVRVGAAIRIPVAALEAVLEPILPPTRTK